MHGPLTVADLQRAVDAGAIHEVIVALPDLHGRLQGSRLGARHVLDHVLDHGFDACAYLLAADVEMQAVPGGAIDPDATGYADLRVRPDVATLRGLPWDDGTALVIGDAHWPDGTAVEVAPRRVLRRQLDALARHGLAPMVGTELEFVVYRESYRQAWEQGWRDLTPATRHNVDYALTGLGDLEPLVRRLRAHLRAAGYAIESARGECHPGQYEIVFRYGPALRACDEHVLYRTAARLVAEEQGMALTFMARVDAGEGSSCHAHVSLVDEAARPAFPGDDPNGWSPTMRRFVAGQLALLPEWTLLFAPTINSYKRLRPGTFAPTVAAWGHDDRRCAVRTVGSGPSLRIEHRVGGADANPYLLVAAVLAAGRYGIEHELPLPDPAGPKGPDGVALPHTLAEAADRFAASDAARKAFGDEVVDHLVAAAGHETATFESAVTDWERARGFERL